MTVEEHNLLLENNKMLKALLSLIAKHDSVTPEEFIANVLANLVSNKIDSIKQLDNGG